MAFRELKEMWMRKYPHGVTKRYVDLDIYDKMLAGSFYDILPYPYEQEEIGKKVIPLKQRRPLFQYSLPVLIRDRLAAQIFGRQARPRVRAYAASVLLDPNNNVDAKATAYIEALIKENHLYDVISEALEVGQSGSVAITVTSLDDKTAYLDVVAGKNCLPIFNPRNPNKLEMLRRLYPINGADLNATGIYDKQFEPDQNYWMRIDLDSKREQWFFPMTDARFQKLGKQDENGRIIAWEEDDERSYNHVFGVVPAVWIRNLNGQRGIDGRCTFQSIVDLQITLDYTASQITRGFHYTADPLLAIERGELDDLIPAGGMSILDAADDTVQTQDIDKTPAKAITIPHGSKAQMLEISGNGLSAAREWFRTLREAAVELLSGSTAGQERTGGAGNPHSGRALEVLNSLEVWLLERQAAAYGDGGLINLILILLAGVRTGALITAVEGTEPPAEGIIVELMWPRRTLLLGQDLLNHMLALQTAAGGSQQTPVQLVPRDVITGDAMAALGHPDPATNTDQVMKEWEETLNTRAEAEAAAKPPAAPASK